MSITNRLKFFPLVKKGFEKVATGLEIAWAEITGKPNVFPPEAHTHPDYIPNTERGIANGVATLDFNNKLTQIQIPDSLLGQVSYQGQYNASTNTPVLPNATTVKGNYYIVSAAGIVNSVYYEIGDWIISDGVNWSKVDNTDAVSSVFGRTGNIIAQAADYNSFFAEKQSSTEDTTSGKGLIVGAFGLGGLSINTDAETISHTSFITSQISGSYRIGLNIVHMSNPNYAFQIFARNELFYVRTKDAGVFSAYRTLYHDGNHPRSLITLSATEPTAPKDGDIWILP